MIVLTEARFLQPGDRVSAGRDVFTVRRVWTKNQTVGLGFHEVGIILLIRAQNQIAKIEEEPNG